MLTPGLPGLALERVLPGLLLGHCPGADILTHDAPVDSARSAVIASFVPAHFCYTFGFAPDSTCSAVSTNHPATPKSVGIDRAQWDDSMIPDRRFGSRSRGHRQAGARRQGLLVTGRGPRRAAWLPLPTSKLPASRSATS